MNQILITSATVSLDLFFFTPPFHLIVVEGFVCPTYPSSLVVWGPMSLGVHPRQPGPS